MCLLLDVLRGQSPDIVHKEIWAHLLAYNLIRCRRHMPCACYTVMAQAALKHDLPPRTISFKSALQTLQAFHPL